MFMLISDLLKTVITNFINIRIVSFQYLTLVLSFESLLLDSVPLSGFAPSLFYPAVCSLAKQMLFIYSIGFLLKSQRKTSQNLLIILELHLCLPFFILSYLLYFRLKLILHPWCCCFWLHRPTEQHS
jgi:hypothetical protein